MRSASLAMQQLPPFLESIQSRKECKNLDLESYLIKPMQRLTKYPLLIQVQPTPDTVVTTTMINGAIGCWWTSPNRLC